MDVIWMLIPLSMVLVLLALRAFVWAVRTRQFDDLDREAARILFEEPRQDAPLPGKRLAATHPSEEQRHD